jgi:hypothetical protein
MIETRFPADIRVQVSKGSRWVVALDLASGDDTWVRAQLSATEAKELARTLVAHAEELERTQGFEAMADNGPIFDRNLYEQVKEWKKP